MTDTLLENVADGVATLTMNRPEALNAMTPDMMAAALDALTRHANDPGVRAIILTGAGRGFCAGGDVKRMDRAAAEPTLEERVLGLRQRMEVSRLLHQIAKPTIAMVRGPAAGAGMSLALACDMRIASETARFTTAFARVGLSGDFGGAYFLTRLVGTAKARELYWLSETVPADQALALGMVNRVVPDDALEAETMAIAKRLADGPVVTLGYMKKNLNAAETGSLEAVFDLEAMHHSRCSQTEDHKEAARAFVEKRKPVFQGR
ncbi:MAG: enoyl-CoA hydratase [Alphaproteobacteria bacterium]